MYLVSRLEHLAFAAEAVGQSNSVGQRMETGSQLLRLYGSVSLWFPNFLSPRNPEHVLFNPLAKHIAPTTKITDSGHVSLCAQNASYLHPFAGCWLENSILPLRQGQRV